MTAVIWLIDWLVGRSVGQGALVDWLIVMVGNTKISPIYWMIYCTHVVDWFKMSILLFEWI